jgi:hypothetical protein
MAAAILRLLVDKRNQLRGSLLVSDPDSGQQLRDLTSVGHIVGHNHTR